MARKPNRTRSADGHEQATRPYPIRAIIAPPGPADDPLVPVPYGLVCPDDQRFAGVPIEMAFPQSIVDCMAAQYKGGLDETFSVLKLAKAAGGLNALAGIVATVPVPEKPRWDDDNRTLYLGLYFPGKPPAGQTFHAEIS